MTQTLLDQARIFVIDDEPANLKLIGRLLARPNSRQLVLIQDPRDVLTHYLEARPDLILLDINMPHLDGYQVMQQLKALNDPLLPPIVIMTAQHGHDHLLKALASGARDFIGKPFERTELLMRVRNLLDAQLAHKMVHDQRAALEQMVQVRTEALHQSRLEVVQRLGRAAEYRDNETGLHIIRMSEYCAVLAKSMGWNDEECALMLHASAMHDVGKIGITDAILLKPGKLEPHEWRIMQTHVTIGAHILEGGDSDLLQLARLIAHSHHEKWDGSGYPDGLAGAAIPQAGRIVALADMFDALTSVRPYKPAWPLSDALAFIANQSGIHFDPEVVHHFQRCLAQILDIRARNMEPEA